MAALYRGALSATRDASIAEDLVQETFKEAWRSFESFQSGTDCKAWLFRILFRVRNRLLQKRARVELVEMESIPEEKLSTRPEAGIIDAVQIKKTMDSLQDHDRTLLILAHAEQFSYKEIASILELPIGTVMSRLSRARSRFRKIFSRIEKT